MRERGPPPDFQSFRLLRPVNSHAPGLLHSPVFVDAETATRGAALDAFPLALLHLLQGVERVVFVQPGAERGVHELTSLQRQF